MVSRTVLAAALAALSIGCATGLPAGARATRLDGSESFTRPARGQEVPEFDDSQAVPLAVKPGARDTAVALAKSLVGRAHIALNGRSYGDDCTGMVRGVYDQVGIDLMTAGEPGDNGVTAIYRFAGRHGRVFQGGRPVAGDLVFFRETYDLNRDGRANDGLTHIGLVENVDVEGTVTVIHRVARGVVRYRMNLEHRDSPTSASGRPVNDWLRTPGPGSKPQLTAQLFAGYATLLPVESHYAGR